LIQLKTRMSKRTKIVLDSDVIIHFIKGGQLPIDVIASSNIKDITEYCSQNGITWITTMDFLWKALTSKLLTEEECNEFIKRVIEGSSKLPVKNIKEFHPRNLF